MFMSHSGHKFPVFEPVQTSHLMLQSIVADVWAISLATLSLLLYFELYLDIDAEVLVISLATVVVWILRL